MFRRVVDGRARGTSTGPSSDKKGAFAGGGSFKVCQVHPRALTPRPLFVCIAVDVAFLQLAMPKLAICNKR